MQTAKDFPIRTILVFMALYALQGDECTGYGSLSG